MPGVRGTCILQGSCPGLKSRPHSRCPCPKGLGKFNLIQADWWSNAGDREVHMSWFQWNSTRGKSLVIMVWPTVCRWEGLIVGRRQKDLDCVERRLSRVMQMFTVTDNLTGVPMDSSVLPRKKPITKDALRTPGNLGWERRDWSRRGCLTSFCSSFSWAKVYLALKNCENLTFNCWGMSLNLVIQ